MSEHRLDSKGRISIPAKLREKLGDVVFVTKGIEEYLALYSKEEWEKQQEKFDGTSYISLSSQARDIVRLLMDKEEINIDGAGRILLPAELREHAHLSQDVKFIKLHNNIEIWDKQIWKDRENSTRETLFKMRKERESSTLENLHALEKELKELGI